MMPIYSLIGVILSGKSIIKVHSAEYSNSTHVPRHEVMERLHTARRFKPRKARKPA